MASLTATPESLDEAYNTCLTIVKSRAKNFYFAFLTLPRRERLAICTVYAFCRTCDDYSDDDLELQQKLDLLEQQRHLLHEALDGRPTTPEFLALQDTVERYGIPRHYFDEIIDGVTMDLTVSRYPSFDELYKYCYLVASVVGLVCIEIFGYSDPKAKEHAIDLGIAMQLVNIMRDVKEDAERDRVYLPQDEMERVGYLESDLFTGVLNGPFDELMRLQSQRAREHFQKAGRLLPLISPKARACPAALQGLYSELLRRIETRGYNVYGPRIRLSTRDKIWLAGKIWLASAIKRLLPRSKSSS